MISKPEKQEQFTQQPSRKCDWKLNPPDEDKETQYKRVWRERRKGQNMQFETNPCVLK